MEITHPPTLETVQTVRKSLRRIKERDRAIYRRVCAAIRWAKAYGPEFAVEEDRRKRER